MKMEKEIDVTIQLEQANAMNAMQRDTIDSLLKANSNMKHVAIGILIAFVITICGFLWYESQFETLESTDEVTTTEVDLNTSGENANAEYINGNQYNDESSHNEGVE